MEDLLLSLLLVLHLEMLILELIFEPQNISKTFTLLTINKSLIFIFMLNTEF